jgi:hypothetical protein
MRAVPGCELPYCTLKPNSCAETGIRVGGKVVSIVGELCPFEPEQFFAASIYADVGAAYFLT